MKVLLVAASDTGGAGIACLRLLRALRGAGVEARMLVLHKGSDDEGVSEWIEPYRGLERKAQRSRQIIAGYLGAKAMNRHTQGRAARWDSFTPPYPSLLNADHPLVKWADVVHLHWCAQFWDWQAFHHLQGKKLLWTFHDLNPVTGGCHFPGECTQFENGCIVCPQLAGSRKPQVVQGFYFYKRRLLQSRGRLALTVIAPSRWISGQARRSTLLAGKVDHVVIPYTFDESIFHPLDQRFCRDVYSLPHGKRIILFVASYFENYRKGMDLLIESLELLSAEKDLVFCAAGRKSSKLGDRIVYLGNVVDERMMAVAYNAADMCVIPSREDNLPNTVGESLFCGTPAVGFDRGGIPDMIEDGVNGIVVPEVSSRALAEGIRRCLHQTWSEEQISLSATAKYAGKVIAELHSQIYQTARTS